MIQKLFHSRLFAIGICATFALAFLLAKKYDERNKAEHYSNADLLVLESGKEPVLEEASIPVVEPKVDKELEFFVSNEFENLDPIIDDPQPEVAQEPREEQSAYPLVARSEPVRSRQNDVIAGPLEDFAIEKRDDFAPIQSEANDSALVEAGEPWDSHLESPVNNRQFNQSRRQSEPVGENPQVSSGSSKVPALLPSASGELNLTARPESAESRPVVRSVVTPSRGTTEPSTAMPGQPTEPVANPPKTGQPKDSGLGSSNFRLAPQPKEGGAFHPHRPETDSRAWLVESSPSDFHPGPIYDGMPYDPYGQINIYEGKTLNATQRPLLEIGRPWYQLGQLSEGYDFLGKHNPVTPQLIVFGDIRTAYASNRQADGTTDSLIATEWNMNWDLRLTSTERFAWFLAPLNDGESNTRYELDNDRYVDEWNADFVFGYFEGDLGALVGGAIGETLPFDLPFAVGVMPLLFQNGVWLEDQFLGVAATIPARHSTRLGISNMDITFFAGFDEILSPAFNNEDDAAKLYGIASFIEANNGYWEIDYAYLEDRDNLRDRSYHNIGIGFTRRYGRWISNSTRIIVNAGQSTAGGPNTADGVLLLSENSLITALPSTVIPYFNFFAGFDRPQKAAGNNVLKNTGILFETDGMTGFPTLDATAQNTYGGAIGVNILPTDFSQQLVLEAAFLGVMGDQADRNAVDDQYGVGARYQLPLNNSVLLRADAMYGFLKSSEDISGVRMELRRKF